MLLVEQSSRIQNEGERAFRVGLLRKEHPLHIGVLDDCYGSAALHTDGATLQPIARVIERHQVASISQHGGSHADGDARLVHHLEHLRKALPLLSHQPADGIHAPRGGVMSVTKVQRAVGYAALSYLLVERYRADIMPGSVGQHFRHDKQRDAFCTFDDPAKW